MRATSSGGLGLSEGEPGKDGKDIHPVQPVTDWCVDQSKSAGASSDL